VVQILRYAGMLLRAYSRDRTALFFGFFFPLIFMILFGVLNLGAVGRVNLGIVDEANSDESQRFIATLSRIEAFRVTTGARAAETDRLTAGDRDIVLVLPADFHVAPARPGTAVPTITVYTSSARPEQGAIGSSVITQVVDQMSFAVTQTAPVVATKHEEVAGRNLRYVDFLTPGILGMTIMQSGIASVAFPFVVDRQRGVLRRIMATPISRRNFLAAHVLQRLVTLVVQVLILLGVAILMFKVAVVGSLLELLGVAILGSAVFLCLGFAVTGLVATENAVPPVTQLVTLPQMFLSGVFFSKDAAPGFLRPIAEYLPLTFLNDALRSVATQGASLSQIAPQLIGLAVWVVVSFVLAFRFFRLDV
jgi:ABC-2 type transport system permease protein